MSSWAAGKVVLVTGSTSGIGRGIALEFARQGCRVIVTGRNEAALKETVDKCNSLAAEVKSPQNAVGLQADLSKREDVAKLIEQAMKATDGRLDILVNNAGCSGGLTTLKGITDESMLKHFDEAIEVNLRSLVHLTHLATPYMIKTAESAGPEGCSIINMSSTSSKKPKSIPYCVSKVGVDMFTQCLALELGPKRIRVNCVNPALVDTAFFDKIMTKEQVKAQLETKGAKYPLRRVGLPEDIANYVAFLCSPQASWVTGTINMIDGGSSLLTG